MIDVYRAAAEPASDNRDASVAAELQVDVPIDILMGSDGEERLARVGEHHGGTAIGREPISDRVGCSLRHFRRYREEIDYPELHW